MVLSLKARLVHPAPQKRARLSSARRNDLSQSHRGAYFRRILEETEGAWKKLLDLPPSHELLFMAGGATAQFAAQALNLFTEERRSADYAVTGQGSFPASEFSAALQRVAATPRASAGFRAIFQVLE